MMRGIEKRPIFVDDFDRQDLLDRLETTLPECGAACLAWAFLSNHVHFAIRVGHTPLSGLMQRVNTGYAVRFNRRHERVGYLFQNRFASKLVSDDAYLRTLIPYILLNPLRAGLVGDLAELERFRWCSYAAVTGRRTPLAFEDVAAALAPFGSASELVTIVARNDLEDVPVPNGGAWMPRTTCPARTDDELERMATAICDYFGVLYDDVSIGVQHAGACRARAVICFVARKQWQLPRKRIARAVGITVDALSHAIARGSRLAETDEALREVIHGFATVPGSVVLG